MDERTKYVIINALHDEMFGWESASLIGPPVEGGRSKAGPSKGTGRKTNSLRAAFHGKKLFSMDFQTPVRLKISPELVIEDLRDPDLLYVKLTQNTVIIRPLRSWDEADVAKKAAFKLLPADDRKPNDSVGVKALPPEMYEKILNNVRNPKDLINCGNVSRVFSQILQARKVQYLFGKVIAVLMQAEHLTFEDLKNCRQVSKEWCKGVERYTNGLPIALHKGYTDKEYRMAMQSHINRRHIGRHSGGPWTCTPLGGTRFWELLHNYCHNHLPVRRWAHCLEITICHESLQIFQGFYNWWSVHHLMKWHLAQDTWHLRLVFRFDLLQWDLEALYAYVNSFIRNFHFLNLRSLQIKIVGYTSEQDADYSEGFWVEAPLPALRTLEVVTEGGEMVTPLLAQGFCLPYADQLTKLSLSHWHPTRPGVVSQLKYLREFRCWQLDDGQKLKDLLMLEAPLQKLSLCFNYGRVVTRDLNRVVSNYSKLRVLEVEWRNGVKPVLPAIGYREIARMVNSLHTLYMQHSGKVKYGCLEWFPNLRFLYLTEVGTKKMPEAGCAPNSKKTKPKESMNIHRYLYEGKGMEKSGVWSALPILQFISYRKVRPGSSELFREMLMRGGRGGTGQDSEILRRFWDRPGNQHRPKY